MYSKDQSWCELKDAKWPTQGEVCFLTSTMWSDHWNLDKSWWEDKDGLALRTHHDLILVVAPHMLFFFFFFLFFACEKYALLRVSPSEHNGNLFLNING